MAESYNGQVHNGLIVPDKGIPPLPEGMRVRIEPAPDAAGSSEALLPA
jgi:hypothetical protein